MLMSLAVLMFRIAPDVLDEFDVRPLVVFMLEAPFLLLGP